MAETVQQATAEKPANKSKKALVIVAVVIIQLLAAYFLIGFFLKRGSPAGDSDTSTVAAKQAVQTGDPNFDHVYVVKDMIVNPAGTNGLRFLLTTIGLEVTSEETVKELEKREVQVHDGIINILTAETLPQLDDTASRDSLKVVIKSQINKDLTTGQVINVYFSKFIIQ